MALSSFLHQKVRNAKGRCSVLDVVLVGLELGLVGLLLDGVLVETLPGEHLDAQAVVLYTHRERKG